MQIHINVPRRETVGAMKPLTALTLATRVMAEAAERAVCWAVAFSGQWTGLGKVATRKGMQHTEALS